jgi:glycosyltransferase involved in cell wall biosynthesis
MAVKKAKNIIYLYSEVMPYAIAVMRALVQEYGATVDCIWWDKNKRTPFVPANEEGITFHERSLFDEDALIKFIEQRAPSIMYVVGRMDELYLKMALHFKRKIKIVTGSDNRWNGSLKQRVAAILSPFIYKRYFEYFWVPGKRQHQYAKRMGYPARKILPNLLTADTSVFGNVYSECRQLRKNKYPHVLAYAGRFAKEKGVDILIEAFIEAKKEVQNDWTLRLIGSGDIKVTDSPFIEVSGFMPGAMLAAECKGWGAFCLPSIYEPWGVVIHEFTLAGLPLICSDNVGATDDLVINGENGFVFKSGSVANLKKAILEMIGKSDEQLLAMGEKGYKLSAGYSPSISAKSLMSAAK